MKFKTHKVIMFSTENESNKLRLVLHGSKLGLTYNNQIKFHVEEKVKHLYILSDDEIKEEDYVVLGDGKTLKRMYTKDVLDWANSYSSATKKIIASTDTSLGLPSPSEDFILKFIAEYNKNTPITEVMVEYEEEYFYTVGDAYWQKCDVITYSAKSTEVNTFVKSELKLKVKNNTIILKKDTFTREEVLKLLLIYEGQCILKGPNNTPSAQEFLNNY